MEFPVLLLFLVLQPPSCLIQYTVCMSPGRKVEVFKDTPLLDTSLIFSIRTLPLLHMWIPPPPPLSPLPIHSPPWNHCTTLYLPLPALVLKRPSPSRPSPSRTSFWLFFDVTFSTTYSSSFSWEVAQNHFKCCKSKSIYHNHLPYRTRQALQRDTVAHSNTQTAKNKKRLSCTLTTLERQVHVQGAKGYQNNDAIHVIHSLNSNTAIN